MGLNGLKQNTSQLFVSQTVVSSGYCFVTITSWWKKKSVFSRKSFQQKENYSKRKKNEANLFCFSGEDKYSVTEKNTNKNARKTKINKQTEDLKKM